MSATFPTLGASICLHCVLWLMDKLTVSLSTHVGHHTKSHHSAQSKFLGHSLKLAL